MESMESIRGALSDAQAKCANVGCRKSSNAMLKACTACRIVSYCCKDCQVADWKQHKALCIGCRPFKECAETLQPQLKHAVHEYSKIVLPSLDEEYSQKCHGRTADAHVLFIKGGLKATREMLERNLQRMYGSGAEDTADLVKRYNVAHP